MGKKRDEDTESTHDGRESDEGCYEDIREEWESGKCPEVREWDGECRECRRERDDESRSELEEVRDFLRPWFEHITEDDESPDSHEWELETHIIEERERLEDDKYECSAEEKRERPHTSAGTECDVPDDPHTSGTDRWDIPSDESAIAEYSYGYKDDPSILPDRKKSEKEREKEYDESHVRSTYRDEVGKSTLGEMRFHALGKVECIPYSHTECECAYFIGKEWACRLNKSLSYVIERCQKYIPLFLRNTCKCIGSSFSVCIVDPSILRVEKCITVFEECYFSSEPDTFSERECEILRKRQENAHIWYESLSLDRNVIEAIAEHILFPTHVLSYGSLERYRFCKSGNWTCESFGFYTMMIDRVTCEQSSREETDKCDEKKYTDASEYDDETYESGEKEYGISSTLAPYTEKYRTHEQTKKYRRVFEVLRSMRCIMMSHGYESEEYERVIVN